MIAGLLVLATSALQAQAHDSAAAPGVPGLPKQVKWTFNFDAGIGAFGFGNSLYEDRPDRPTPDLSDNWLESYVKPAISGVVHFGHKNGEVFGKLSAVGERTYSAPPPLVGEDASSFKVEDMYIGWRCGADCVRNPIEITVGRAPYKIGHGMLLWDGAAEGGSRGGFWSNARKAWGFAAVARFTPKHNTLEGFYLDKDELPESDAGTRVMGVNYERTLGEGNTLGATYLHTLATDLGTRNGMNVFNVRAFVAPLKKMPGLSFELEYAYEKNADLIKASAWNALAAYELSGMKWKPKLSYRYAIFGGDDPATTTVNEGFDGLLTGFYDWGTWWQGEIAGEYFLSNSNLISHQVRVHLTPFESLSGGVMLYVFRNQHPILPVTANAVANELDVYSDWKVNANFIVSIVAALGDPKEAVEQASGRTSSFTYAMIYAAYAF